MASYVTPKKNTAFICYVGLNQQADSRLLKSNPTLATGDFKVSIDGGAFANLTTLPTVTPASGTSVKISLSASEMNGDNIVIACIDASGAEWCDKLINIQTSARQIDDLAYPATSGRSMVVDAAGLVDANVVKVGPTGSGTAQTARDIGGAFDSSGRVTLIPSQNPSVLNGTASAGSASTITLTGGVATDNYYRRMVVVITGGTGVGQIGIIASYVGSTKVATMDASWTTTPDATSVFTVLATVTPLVSTAGNVTVGTIVSAALTTIAGAVWNALTASYNTASTFGLYVQGLLPTASYTTPPTVSAIRSEMDTNSTRLAHLDADISTRSTYAGGDTAGTTTLLSRIASALTITGGKVDVNDKTGFSLSSAGVQAIWDAATSALSTVGSIGKLLVTNIDALISSRLSSGGYTAPDNTSITAIKAKTDNLPSDPTSASVVAARFTTLDTAVAAIQNNVSTRMTVPEMMQILSSSSNPIVFEFYLYNTAGDMEDADSLPTINVINASGTSRNDHLSSTTFVRIETGHYRLTYTVLTTDTEEQLRFEATAIVGGKTRKFGSASQTLTDIVSQFTASDRSDLQAVKSKTDNLPVDPASQSAVEQYIDGTAIASISSKVTAIKAKTDNLPSDPSSQSTNNNNTYGTNTLLQQVKAKTDKLTFDADNNVEATVAAIAGTLDANVVSYATGQSPEEQLATTITQVDEMATNPAGGGS